MSDKWITYGPGKDIDPDKTKGRCDTESFIRMLKEDLALVMKAIEQREESRHESNKELMSTYAVLEHSRPDTANYMANHNRDRAMKGLVRAYALLNRVSEDQAKKQLSADGNPEHPLYCESCCGMCSGCC